MCARIFPADNVCIMAYGQTGSGKTYTMMGPKNNPGVNRRTIQELVSLVTSDSETLEVTITRRCLRFTTKTCSICWTPKGASREMSSKHSRRIH